MQLKGKTALVTGASMGIGNAIARGLAAEGVQLLIAARRRNLLDDLAKHVAATGAPKPHVVEIDLSADGAPAQLAKAAMTAFGHVDILVNSAGGSRLPVPIDASE